MKKNTNSATINIPALHLCTLSLWKGVTKERTSAKLRTLSGQVLNNVSFAFNSNLGEHKKMTTHNYFETPSYFIHFFYREWTRTRRSIYMKKRSGYTRRSTDQLRIAKVPPEFTLPLYNRNVYEGDSAVFSITGKM